MGNGSFGQGHLADADLLWPGGLVEYKFYRTFPRLSDSLTRIEMLSWSFQETPAQGLEGDELHQQQNLLHQVWASRHLESKLRDHRTWSLFINNVTKIASVSFKISRPWVFKWVWDARWAAVVVLELALFRQRPCPPGSWAPPLARLCARTQSDNTVGKVLELGSQTAHQLKLGLKFFCSNE